MAALVFFRLHKAAHVEVAEQTIASTEGTQQPNINAPRQVQNKDTEVVKLKELKDQPTVDVGLSKAEADTIPQTDSSPIKLNLSEFRSLTAQAMKTLPKQAPIEGLTQEEAEHRSPKDFESSRPFFDIVQAVADNPNLGPAAFDFYKECANSDTANISYVLRSRCLSKMKVLAPGLGRESEVAEVEKNVNPNIKRFSDFINN